MKYKIMLVIILVAVAWAVGQHRSETPGEERGGQVQGGTSHSYQLLPGASVEVKGINGSVDVETSDSDKAEVQIVSSSDSQQIIVEQTPTSLLVQGRQSGRHWWRFWGDDVRQQVLLKIPRQAELTTRGVNGPVRIGELDGTVTVSGINGRVEMRQAARLSEVSGVNGGVSIEISGPLGEQGIRVRGINGRVEMRAGVDLNADLDVKGLNGQLSLEVPNVTMQEKLSRSNMRARIGAGGAPISVIGVNGSLSLERSAPVGSR